MHRLYILDYETVSFVWHAPYADGAIQWSSFPGHYIGCIVVLSVLLIRGMVVIR